MIYTRNQEFFILSLALNRNALKFCQRNVTAVLQGLSFESRFNDLDCEAPVTFIIVHSLMENTGWRISSKFYESYKVERI